MASWHRCFPDEAATAGPFGRPLFSLELVFIFARTAVSYVAVYGVSGNTKFKVLGMDRDFHVRIQGSRCHRCRGKHDYPSNQVDFWLPLTRSKKHLRDFFGFILLLTLTRVTLNISSVPFFVFRLATSGPHDLWSARAPLV